MEEKHEKLFSFSLSQAARYRREKNYSRCFAHYLVVAQLNKSHFLSHLHQDFLSIVSTLTKKLEDELKYDDINKVYEQATEALPDNPELLTNQGSYLFRQGQMSKAEALFRKSLSIDPSFLLAKDRLENLASTVLDRWHFPMLNDFNRNQMYKKAISGQVSGRTVLDVGTGTGLLSLMCVEAGAAKVVACEANEVLVTTARDVFRVNGVEEKVKLVGKLSLEMDKEDVPEKVDVLVTETFDAGLLGEHVLESLLHAWHTFLHPSSTVIPARAEFLAAPISCPHVSLGSRLRRHQFGYLHCSGLEVEVAREEPYTSEQLAEIEGGYEMLAQPRVVFTVDFNNVEEIVGFVSQENRFTVRFPVERGGRCDAIAAWFRLGLDSEFEAVIETGPLSGSCWQQAIFVNPCSASSQNVYAGTDVVEAEFCVNKHVSLETVKVDRTAVVHQNGVNGHSNLESNGVRKTIVNPEHLRQINDDTICSVTQRVAYCVARDSDSSRVLDMTRQLPLLSLQLLLLNPQLQLTLAVEGDSSGKKVLDLVTALASINKLPLDNIDCVTSVPTSSTYTLAILAPVSACGRLDQTVLLDVPAIRRTLVPATGLLLPWKIELWCQVIESSELSKMSHLTSDEPVLGFKIADQINILAVTHIQDLKFQSLEKIELSAETHLANIELTHLDNERTIKSENVGVTRGGVANAVIYWFVQDFGWGLTLDTRKSTSMSQAAFMCTPTNVEQGGSIGIRWQVERGLLDISFC